VLRIDFALPNAAEPGARAGRAGPDSEFSKIKKWGDRAFE
jgi:hypothetical protein